MDAELSKLVEDWCRWDNDESSLHTIKTLQKENKYDELDKLMRPRISFGTSGLRAEISPGFSGMNDLTVLQASQGFAAYLTKTVENAKEKGVVVGHDHRHKSKRFARLTATAFVHAGFKVYLYDQLVHTPLVPFAVKTLKAAAGVMITASHNPAAYNGYKVYWENACAIIPPHDKGIAECIMENLEPTVWDDSGIEANTLCDTKFIEKVLSDYWSELRNFHMTNTFDKEFKALGFVYTPMHGVGLPYVEKALSLFGEQNDMHVVQAQRDPDPDFPTVRFPNPEEKGALDMGMQLADELGLNYVLATDPDADRFAIAEKYKGKWNRLTGDEIGCIMGYFIFSEYRNSGKPIDDFYVLSTTVSSAMMTAMAKKEGFHHVQTLTGFKWLGNRALELENQGKFVGLAYEEAIGYLVGNIVRDKDGVNALITFLHLLKRLQQNGKSISETFDDLGKKYGFFATNNSYYYSKNSALLRRLVDNVRHMGPNGTFVNTLGSHSITRIRDLTINYDSSTPDNKALLPCSSSSDNVTFELDNGQVIFTIRTSGTEPKLKYYICARAESHDKAASIANDVKDCLSREWFRPAENGMTEP
ncbi:phosphoglucomutase [Schizosaccharomyces japonicus yFS275]|uniref:Phosphoglucomutase n=1 Tax=Schizosaccharomyces japonicus (strain yFS275 / FY16936) TaxID=402676 RepID=B6JXJ2_SCHJY|nr:phosphoglucomutase [Schizosaccharomyces japonicus yFS275]EEB05136.1 phosphoglucomutase [Schizosaccharomyces japonicus yFS275]